MKIWICLLAAFIIGQADAQTVTTGEVTGAVLDSSGAIVVGASVLLKNLEMGETSTVRSNGAGLYRFTFVKPGTYEISSASAGLKSDKGTLVAGVGQVLTLDLTLKVEASKDVLLVTDSTPVLQGDNANIAYTVSTRQLELLPLPGGDLTAVAYSLPGVVVTTNPAGRGNFASQGIGPISNLFTVNGLEDMDIYWGTNNSGLTGMMLGANEIREVSIVQNPYEGQYGRQAGTQIDYVSKSGANAFHGNLLYNYNGTLLNANDFFSNRNSVTRPHAVSNQYAAAAGGRVVRDKLFFFADTEGMRFVVPADTPVVIPSQALQSFALRSIQPSQVPLYQKVFDLYNNAPGHERAIAVTTGNGSLQDSSGRLGCGTFAGTPNGSGGVFGNDVPCAQAWSVARAWIDFGMVDGYARRL